MRARRLAFFSMSQDGSSCFFSSLERWRETNISGDFKQFCRDVTALSRSLGLVIINQDKIITAIVAVLASARSEAYSSRAC